MQSGSAATVTAPLSSAKAPVSDDRDVAIPIVSAAVVCEQEQSSGIPMARCWITPQPVTPT
jgi:hypothetical protein